MAALRRLLKRLPGARWLAEVWGWRLFLPLQWRVRRAFRKRFGRKLDVRSPQTLDEKLNVLKMHPATENWWRFADKLAVRGFVASRLGESALVPLLGEWKRPGDVDFAALPREFVLKANHGSGTNLVVRDRDALDIPATRALMREWLRENHYRLSGERLYRRIPPRLFAEALLPGADGKLPLDYKIHCFGGHALFVQVDIDRETAHRRNFYSPDWRPLDFVWSDPAPDGSPLWPHGPPVARPALLPEMLRAARALSRGFPYVRVDLYAEAGRVWFGELTFFHGSGLEPFWPPAVDARLGRLLRSPLLERKMPKGK